MCELFIHLLIKINILGCELMVDPSVKLNNVQAEKICKQTEDLYPYHPTVYKLKERLLASNGNCDPSKAENLLNCMSFISY